MRCRPVSFATLICLASLVLGGATFAVAANKGVSSPAKGTSGPTDKILPATEAEADAAITMYRKWGDDAARKLKIEFTTLETPHFLIFTDWDPREHNFLKQNVEDAYSAVSKQFELSAKDNVFVGKLPIFMITSGKDFLRFATELSQMQSPPKGLAGYFTGRSDGFGYMVMWKPDIAAAGGDVHAAEREWAHVLIHEFTHAFVARYRTNGTVPRWLSEGVAEVISGQKFPRAGLHGYVKRMMLQGKGIMKIFGDKDFNSFTADDYPYAQTVVETLVAGDAKAFLHYFNDIKDGMDPDEALDRNYHTDRDGLQTAWKRYMKSMAHD